jgi:pimeloyl-ACP methyl ester carboxylesterase
MGRLPMTDLIVVLPGIGGSTLRDAAGPVFEPTAHTLWRAARHRADLLETLAGDESLDDPDVPPKVWPSGLISLPVAVPGFGSVTAYQRLRQRLTDAFELTSGDPAGGGPPANYFEFPYDWRRDNRVSAELLRRLVRRELPRWAATLADGEPKVILIGHSMGGLVAKYYLDALGGWQQCRALLTFGTPFRGSVKALDLLVNGISKYGVEAEALSELVRRFTSVYQLLPRYPVIRDLRQPGREGAAPLRVTELDADLGGLRLTRAKQAREDFHRMLDTDRSTHAGIPLQHLIDMVPVIGYGHKTRQSAILDDRHRLRCLDEPPAADANNPWFGGGDRTVPALSALPIELSEAATAGHLTNQTHTVLHGRGTGLDWIVHTLARYGASLLDQQLPRQGGAEPAWEPALGLVVDEVFLPDEPVVVRCSVPAASAGRPAGIRFEPAEPALCVPDHTGDTLSWRAEGLTPGTYTVTVTAGDRSVSDAFEVG